MDPLAVILNSLSSWMAANFPGVPVSSQVRITVNGDGSGSVSVLNPLPGTSGRNSWPFPANTTTPLTTISGVVSDITAQAAVPPPA